MAHVWRPSAPGKLFTSAPKWTIELDGESLRIAMGGQHRVISVGELASLNVKPGIFWATLYLSFANGSEVCPKCGKGFLMPRVSKFGPFLSFSTFPRCDYKRDGCRMRRA